ncbi:hypothetical protein SASPL_132907 [Salvia splendens]|uniref:Jasmonate O-methyltransferase n=1 Tax=Salvia splendens TaxID=180675 RepID=A0A8X8X429_SALSN|nr:hypothetical protein SASPL_132907 [Salvia splendens]
MNGGSGSGSGTYSYARNSTWQRNGAAAMEDALKEAAMESLDLQKVLCDSNTFVVADLGCSVGHHHRSPWEEQAGSFYGSLFPSSSIHIAYSSSALNWLSKVPEGSIIHYNGAPDAVASAYEAQFEEDMEVFFRCRAREIAAGGLMLFSMAAVPSRDVQHPVALMYTFIESILIDMVKEVDSFNLPIVLPSIEEIRRLAEKNKCFEIVKMENAMEGETKIAVMHLRAGLEGTLTNHFGNEIVEQVFERAMQQHHNLQSTQIHTSSAGIFVVLRRH